ncbi:hypothetical protein Ppro_1653 [Pelobacter propionicus DSM 2379]|uniref:Uncharacterized protein n=1 Tax=Pelobacter propionicus (strain DSM 2379 / NBRC 103807 / OttBd1) TaxID=338966 RepID=A1APJ7_PELPD|nr:hypothetical protein Ppro_1653 [Pelobacter propionicus DSM 2379]
MVFFPFRLQRQLILRQEAGRGESFFLPIQWLRQTAAKRSPAARVFEFAKYHPSPGDTIYCALQGRGRSCGFVGGNTKRRDIPPFCVSVF